MLIPLAVFRSYHLDFDQPGSYAPRDLSSDNHTTAIIQFLSRWEGPMPRPRKLARLMGIGEESYRQFRQTYERLRKEGLLITARGESPKPSVKGAPKALVGRFQANPRGFGFVTVLPRDGRGDIFVPPGRAGGAMTGDMVALRLVPGGRRGGQLNRCGEVEEILERGLRWVVGSLERTGGAGLVHSENKPLDAPILILEEPEGLGDAAESGEAPAPRVAPKDVPPGSKVLVEVVEFPEGEGMLPVGVIREVLGPAGDLATETLAVIRTHELPDRFPAEALAEAERLVADFDPSLVEGREDLTDLTVITIDPVDARDFDDAISLEANDDGSLTLGVHIADVAHFVDEGSALDVEARLRGNSVYFPRKVIPMLPEALSADLCCLREGVPRLAKSVFLTYDAKGEVLRERMAETVIISARRLTYEGAQQICDGATEDPSPVVTRLIRELHGLAKRIQARRSRGGMLALALPEVELVLDETGRVIDAKPAGQEFTHTLIEMFMVEANEAVARRFAELDAPLMRRIHPPPDEESSGLLRALADACGHPLPDREPTRRDLQKLLRAVEDKPEGYPINLALLRSFQQARYSLDLEGHYALASEHYCHFTSPIRRYPDLLAHRLLTRDLRGRSLAGLDRDELERMAQYLSETERRAEAAERELRQILVLQHLTSKLGESFQGVVTAVADFGLFVQFPRYLIEGLLRLEDLGDEPWDVDLERGRAQGARTGRVVHMGSVLEVTIAQVDVPRRFLDLTLTGEPDLPKEPRSAPAKGRKGERPSDRRHPRQERTEMRGKPKKGTSGKPKGTSGKPKGRKR
jgi:ribonuclease R